VKQGTKIELSIKWVFFGVFRWVYPMKRSGLFGSMPVCLNPGMLNLQISQKVNSYFSRLISSKIQKLNLDENKIS